MIKESKLMSEILKPVFILIATLLLAFLFLNLSSALSMQGFPSNLQASHGSQNQFSFNLIEDNGVNVTNINASCSFAAGTCSISCPSQILANSTITCEVNFNVNQFTPPSMYDLNVNISYNESGTPGVLQNTTQINVLASESISLSLDLDDMKSDEKQVKNLIIKNTGNTDLSINLSAWIEDSDGNEINYFNLSLSQTSLYLQPNQSQEIEITLQAIDALTGSYTLKIKASYDGNTKTESFDFDVSYAYCTSSSNYLTATIYNEDSFRGDNFEPYESFDIEVKVSNDADEDIDVEISAVLVKDNNVIEQSEITETATINANDDEIVKLNFKVPLIGSGRYDVYVKAYDIANKTSCSQDSSYIDVVRPTHKVKIKNIYLDKESYQCGDQIFVSGSLVNIGLYDEDVVKLVYSDDLGNEVEDSFSLDKGDEKNFIFQQEIPLNASEGSHKYYIKIYYDYDFGNFNKVDSYTYPFNVKGNCIKPKRDVNFSINLPETLEINKTYNGTISITNTGDLMTTYVIKVNADWADIKLEKSLVTLAAGKTSSISFEITPRSYGNQIEVKLSYYGEEKNLAKQVEVIEQSEWEEGKYKKASWWDEIRFEFKRRPWAFWVVIASLAVAIISLIGIIILLVKTRK